MAKVTRRGTFVDKGLNAKLVDVIERAAAAAPSSISRVEMTSGIQGRAYTKNHPAGRALDVQLYAAGGQPLFNQPLKPGRESAVAANFRAYEEFAQLAKQIQSQVYPELDSKFAWGGYFGPDKKGLNAFDLMHFDVGGYRGKMGSFATGLYPAAYNLIPGAASAPIGSAPGNIASGAAAARGTVIGKGSSKDDISGLQAALSLAGHSPGDIDGLWGPDTRAAVEAFQKSQGYTLGNGLDGKAGPQTLGALQQAVSAKLGGPAAVGQVFGGPQAPQAAPTVFTGNLPRARPSTAPAYVPPRAGLAVAGPAPTINAPANRAIAPSIGLQGTATGALGRGVSAAATAAPFANRSPGNPDYDPLSSMKGRTPSAFGVGSDVPANWQDRAKIAEAIPNTIPRDIGFAAMDRAAQIRDAQVKDAFWNAPPSVGAGFTTPAGMRSPEAFASAKPQVPSGFESIWNNLTSPAAAAPRSTMNYAAAPPSVSATPASRAISAAIKTDNMGNPEGDKAYGTGRAGNNVIGGPLSSGSVSAMMSLRNLPGAAGTIAPAIAAGVGNVGRMISGVGSSLVGAIPSGVKNVATALAGGVPRTTAPSVAPMALAPTPRSVAQSPGGQAITAAAPGQAAAAVPKGLGSLLMSPEARPSIRPAGITTFTPTPVKTQSFPGLQQTAPNAPPQGVFAAPQAIADRAISQLKSAQPPAPPSVSKQAGQASIAPSRAAGGRTFNPAVAAVQKSLRDAGVTDFQGNSLTVDGIMGPRTASAISSPAGRAVLGGGLASQGSSQSTARSAPSVSSGGSSGSSGGSSNSGVNTSRSAGPGNTDAFGNSYGSSSYGTGARGY